MENKKRSISTKTFAILLAVMLIIGCMAGGTIAWLIDQSGSVTNTFTYGNISIELAEGTTGPYKIVPGVNITKDPKVTVKPNSEDCWLFVKVVEDELIDELTWNPANGWTLVPNETDVYYREVESNTTAQEFKVIADDKITVSDTLTKTTIDGLTNEAPKLTFKAYAVQKEGFTTPEAAWAEASK